MNSKVNATELDTENRKQKLDNIINKITESQLSKIREAANLDIDNAVESVQDFMFTINPRQASDNVNETDKAKPTKNDEKEVGGGQGGESEGEGGAGTSSDLPAPGGHEANM